MVIETWIDVEARTGGYKNTDNRPDWDGRIYWADLAQGRAYRYEPARGTVTVSKLPPEDFFPDGIASILALIQHIIDEGSKFDGVTFTYLVEEQNGVDVQVLDIVKVENNWTTRSRMTIDPETHLPMVGEKRMTDPQGAIVSESRTTFDYPEKGPASMYELGVPESTPIIQE